jgi:F-type H+-transporting ATPase subunit a
MASEKKGFDAFSHVADSDHFEFFEGVQVHLPFTSKFMLLQLIAATILILVFVPFAKRISNGQPPKGRLANFLEFLLTFIRDQVAKPGIGDHDYRRFLPYLWSLFLFILTLNLLGMLPFMASATASLGVTGALALVSFFVIHYNGIKANHGFAGYMKSFIPNIDTSDPIMKWLGPPILVMMFVLEIMTAFIRALVLAIRLFANMLAGHTVLFILLSFIPMAHNAGASDLVFWGVTVSSVFTVVGLSMLELFVACLQAFVFTFLTSIFIGLAMHPQH